MELVLGVDPGLTRCGLAVISVRGRNCALETVQVARTPAEWETPQRLQAIAIQVEDLLSTYPVGAIALERVFAQHNVASVMGTAQISGVLMLLAERAAVPLYTYTPSEVKAAVAGNGRADKKQVAFMVTRILGLAAAPKPADAADALAIAITHAWRGSSGAGKGEKQTTLAQQKWAAAVRHAAKPHR